MHFRGVNYIHSFAIIINILLFWVLYIPKSVNYLGGGVCDSFMIILLVLISRHTHILASFF